MDLVIISGRSGSGKTSALHVLEDIGYYCVDNLPVTLLPALTEQLGQDADTSINKVAVGIDARNNPSQLNRFPSVLTLLREKGIDVQVIYLDADNSTLLKRFSETRRKHPISNKRTSLQEALKQEKALLDPISSSASLQIDTSKLSLHDLRDAIKDRVDTPETGMAILIQSFGFKHGIPVDADFVFDVRCLPNPHWVPALRSFTGRDENVASFLHQHESVQNMIRDIIGFLEKWIPSFADNNRSYTTIAIGCTGGQHRSVYITEQVSAYFMQRLGNVQARHREL